MPVLISMNDVPYLCDRVGGDHANQCHSDGVQNSPEAKMRNVTVRRSQLGIIGNLASRLERSSLEAAKVWAELKRDTSNEDLLRGYVRLLRRCDRLTQTLGRSLP